MAKKRPPTIEACKRRSNRVLQLDHVELFEEDIDWLSKTEHLTLWNVRLPAGLLARIEKLWWLDIRGGTATNLAAVSGVDKLQYLAVNQVRGLGDISLISEMTTLRYLDIYGLRNVTEFPSCTRLVNLEYVRLGQMRGLTSLHDLLQAPKLRELDLVRSVNITKADVDDIISHPTIGAFGWFPEDVPQKGWAPVIEKIKLSSVRYLQPGEWFQLPESTSAD
jgi:hypothetical protein